MQLTYKYFESEDLTMERFVCIWYDMNKEVCREVINASSKSEAERIAHMNHSEDPAPLLTVVKESDL